MRVLKQSTVRNLSVLMISSTDHITGLAGLTLTITSSKDGAAFATITPTVTDLGSGWYKLALTTAHTDTLGDLALHITSTGADPQDLLGQVVAYDMTDAAALGLSRLDVASSTRMATFTLPTNFSAMSITAGGLVDITQTAADKAWSTATRVLTAGTNIVLAKGTGVTGFNDPTTASISTAVWQDATAGDFTTVGSIGKSLFTAGNAPGAASGIALVGSNMGTVTSVTGAVGSVTGAVGSVTGNVGGNVVGSVASVTAGVTVTTNNDKASYSLSAAGNLAIWDVLTSLTTTVGSMGKRIVDFLTGDAYARLGAPAGASVSADIAALPTATGNADALLDRSAAIETGLTPRGALRLIAAATAGNATGLDTGSVVIKNAVAATKTRIAATGDTSGNRTVTSTDVT